MELRSQRLVLQAANQARFSRAAATLDAAAALASGTLPQSISSSMFLVLIYVAIVHRQ